MKYHILHVFKTSIEFIKKSSGHFIDIYELKPLTSFHVNITDSRLHSLVISKGQSFSDFKQYAAVKLR